MKETNISIIIPAYNEENFIEKCINSVKKQKTKLNYEIIVVDNNSTDKTKEIAKKQNIKIINEKKQGVGAARKTGTEHAKGEIVVHIDADTILYPNHLERVWKYFKEDKELACLGGQFVFYHAPLWKNIFRKVFYKPLALFGRILSRGVIGPTGGNMAFRKDLYEKTEGFDLSLKFAEDVDICQKFKQYGKIRVDFDLKVKVSSRRFQINKKFLIYTINFFALCFTGKPYKNVLPN